nr:phosphoenolpyruvate--protein phosphotransferase [Moraxella sp. Tifton1]
MQLTTKDVRMNLHAADKKEALAMLADILVEDGLTTQNYVHGLYDREAQTTTYLGQGIAIPHGTPQSRDDILATGVRLAHFPDGVVWGDEGELVYLAVVIAARSDEHLQILKQLTKILSQDIAQKINSVKTADELLAIINDKPQSLLLNQHLIQIDEQAKDADALFATAVTALKKTRAVNTLSLLPSQPLAVSDLVQCISFVGDDHQVAQSALSLAIAKHDITPRAVAVIVANEKLDARKLASVYDVLMGEEFGLALHQADIHAILQLLDIQETSWPSKDALILNEHGLHARPATILSALAKQAKGEIRVSVDGGDFVSAKSLSRLLSLGAVRGQTLTFIAEPNTEAQGYLEKLTQAVTDGLGEKVLPLSHRSEHAELSDADALVEMPADKHLERGEKIPATIASSGVAIGTTFVVREQQVDYPMIADDPQAEFERLIGAIERVKAELSSTIASANNADVAQIFMAHVALLDDEEMVFEAKAAIDAGSSAEAAWQACIDDAVEIQSKVTNPLLAQRAADLKDVGQKVLLALTGQDWQAEPKTPYVLVKEDLLPSDVARLDPSCVAGILTAVGGSSSHSAIVARALGIPALVGVGFGILDISQDTPILVNASEGWFVIEPSDAMILQGKQAQESLKQRQQLANQHALDSAITIDGHQVEVAVNLGGVHDAASAVASGADGVGLLRTELVFMTHDQVPDVQAQMRDYEQVFDAFDARPVVVRTLDVGGDKPLSYLPMPDEDNPFLGLRGIRLSLKQPKMLKDQLTALILASKGRDLRIMFPMVSKLEEWLMAKSILEEVKARYPHDRLQVGIMIEVPSAAIMANAFAGEVDFFSIGTNDLTQYVMAIDRGHPVLSQEADGLHPSVLMLIHQTIKAAHAHGKWVGVCGELAGDSKAIPILLGLGVDELSMSVSSIALAKQQVRELSLAECQVLAKHALNCRTANEVRALRLESDA